MKRSLALFSSFVVAAAIGVGTLSVRLVQAQGRGGRGSPEAQAARAKQLELEKNTPQLKITEDVLPLSVPGHTIGETEGISKNSKGHLFIYSRTGTGGSSRGGTAAELFEFDQNLKFVKLWGPDNYAASFAHSVRVDKYDNVWMVDEGSGMIVKFDPTGMVKMVLGRKPEAIDYLERFLERGEKEENRYPVGAPYTFNRETDVAWDSHDNIYVSDGYGNSRFAKFTKDGTWVGAVGTHGSGPDQFSTPHGIAVDGKDNVYVADRGNNRVQVYSADMKYEKTITGMGAPWSVCITPGPHQYMYSGDGFSGKLYKFDLEDDKLMGWAQTSQGHGQGTCLIHEIHCESAQVVYKGDCSTWTAEKITVK
ncbi:MAG TPA: 6-bladed beta-propeller [Bryobacteraceae bacterium]